MEKQAGDALPQRRPEDFYVGREQESHSSYALSIVRDLFVAVPM